MICMVYTEENTDIRGRCYKPAWHVHWGQLLPGTVWRAYPVLQFIMQWIASGQFFKTLYTFGLPDTVTTLSVFRGAWWKTMDRAFIMMFYFEMLFGIFAKPSYLLTWETLASGTGAISGSLQKVTIATVRHTSDDTILTGTLVYCYGRICQRRRCWF